MDDRLLGPKWKGSFERLSATDTPHELGEIPGLGGGNEGSNSEDNAGGSHSTTQGGRQRQRQSTLGNRRISHASVVHRQKLEKYMQKHLENQMIEWKQQHAGGTFIEYIQEVCNVIMCGMRLFFSPS